jgi:hypothetical protein
MEHLQHSTLTHVNLLFDRSDAVAAAAFPFSGCSKPRAAERRASIQQRWQAPKCRRHDPERA